MTDRKDNGQRRHASAISRRALLLGVPILVVTIVAGWWMTREQPVERNAPVVRHIDRTLPTAAAMDSQKAAVTAQRWTESVEWAELLATREPNDPMRMLEVAMAWHNLAWGSESAGRPRAAARTSLDRARMANHALAVLDSALSRARTPNEAARVLHWMGQIHEIYGLPIEAALGYQEALANDPNFDLSIPRARWIMRRLHDPLGKR